MLIILWGILEMAHGAGLLGIVIDVVLVAHEAEGALWDQNGDGARGMALVTAVMSLGHGMRAQHCVGPVTLGALGGRFVVVCVARLAGGAFSIQSERDRLLVAVDAALLGVDVVGKVDRAATRVVILNGHGERSYVRYGKIVLLVARGAVAGRGTAVVADVTAARLLECQAAMARVCDVASDTGQGLMAVVGEGVGRGARGEGRRWPRQDVALAATGFFLRCRLVRRAGDDRSSTSGLGLPDQMESRGSGRSQWPAAGRRQPTMRRQFVSLMRCQRFQQRGCGVEREWRMAIDTGLIDRLVAADTVARVDLRGVVRVAGETGFAVLSVIVSDMERRIAPVVVALRACLAGIFDLLLGVRPMAQAAGLLVGVEPRVERREQGLHLVTGETLVQSWDQGPPGRIERCQK